MDHSIVSRYANVYYKATMTEHRTQFVKGRLNAFLLRCSLFWFESTGILLEQIYVWLFVCLENSGSDVECLLTCSFSTIVLLLRLRCILVWRYVIFIYILSYYFWTHFNVRKPRSVYIELLITIATLYVFLACK